MHSLIFLAPVPIPETSITKNPSQHDVHFAGSRLDLICSVALAAAVDLPVIVLEQWLKDGLAVTQTSRILIHPPVPRASHRYEAVLEFSTLSEDVDNGEYRCHVTVKAKPFPNTTSSIVPSDESRTKTTLSIKGKICACANTNSATNGDYLYLAFMQHHG